MENELKINDDIKKLNNNAEEIGTMKLSIPRTLICSSKVAIKAIVK